MKAYFERLFRHVAWADRRSMEALRAAPAAHGEALPLLAHLLAAEHVWLSRLLQREPRLPVWPALSIDECKSLSTENETGYRAFLQDLGESQYVTPIRYRTTQGVEFETPVLDILTQVVSHGAYHRGQIARAIRLNDGVAVNTDFITFSRECRVGDTSPPG